MRRKYARARLRTHSAGRQQREHAKGIKNRNACDGEAQQGVCNVWYACSIETFIGIFYVGSDLCIDYIIVSWHLLRWQRLTSKHE